MSGIGIGYRTAIAEDLLALGEAPFSFLEVHPENVMRRGGSAARDFAKACERWPLLSHGLSLSLGGDRFDTNYLGDLRKWLAAHKVPWHTDHLSFSSDQGRATHELLPLLRTEETVRYVAARVREAQERLECPLAIENVTYYAESPHDRLSEGEFVTAVCEEADCALLLDVNNVFVNACNFGDDPLTRLRTLPLSRTVHMHVAGHLVLPEDNGRSLRLDTHAEPVCEDVFTLLSEAYTAIGDVPLVLEHDDQFPPIEELLETVRRLDDLRNRALRLRVPAMEGR